MKTTLQKHVSGNIFQYFKKEPDILDFRFTNQAMLGLFFDDDFTHIPMIEASLGFMYNGAVAEKGSGLPAWGRCLSRRHRRVRQGPFPGRHRFPGGPILTRWHGRGARLQAGTGAWNIRTGKPKWPIFATWRACFLRARPRR